jgi:hypothetical protein
MDSICTRRASDDPASLAITKHVLLDNAEGEGVPLDGYYGISAKVTAAARTGLLAS